MHYADLVQQAGGETKAEMLVVKNTGLQPEAYAAKSPAERVPYLENALGKESFPPLSEREADVDALVRSRGHATGKEICTELGISEKVLSNHIIPALKERGLKNRRTVGYYYPAK